MWSVLLLKAVVHTIDCKSVLCGCLFHVPLVSEWTGVTWPKTSLGLSSTAMYPSGVAWFLFKPLAPQSAKVNCFHHLIHTLNISDITAADTCRFCSCQPLLRCGNNASPTFQISCSMCWPCTCVSTASIQPTTPGLSWLRLHKAESQSEWLCLRYKCVHTFFITPPPGLPLSPHIIPPF